MALTRSILKGMGLTGEQIDTIIDAHAETVDGLKEERDGYKANGEKLKETEKKLKEAEKEIEALKSAGDDGWKEKHDAVKKEFDAYKEEIASKEAKAAKEKAYRDVLKDANLNEKGIEKAVKYADWDAIELEGEAIKDAKNLIKAAKEEWAEYVVKTNAGGANVRTPINTGGTGGAYNSKADVMAIADRSERRKAIAENPHLFVKGE